MTLSQTKTSDNSSNFNPSAIGMDLIHTTDEDNSRTQRLNLVTSLFSLSGKRRPFHERADAAFRRICGALKPGKSSILLVMEGKRFAILTSANGLLAVFHDTTSGVRRVSDRAVIGKVVLACSKSGRS